MCGVIGGIGGLIVEVLLFIIKGSQLDAHNERMRKRAAATRTKVIRRVEDADSAGATAANTSTVLPADQRIYDSAAGVDLETKKRV